MKILFFTPLGSRTGSEMVLWYLMKHLAGTATQTAIYCREAGELFLKESPTPHTFLHKWHRGFLYKTVETIIHKLTGKTHEQWYVLWIHRKFKPDVWYLNTITMGEFGKLAQQLNIPYIVHIHEMLGIYDTIPAVEFEKMLTKSKMIIGDSSVVVNQLNSMGFKNVKLLYEFVETNLIIPNTPALDIKKQLNLPANAFVWLMSGSVCMRKGIDFVPDLLNLLPKNAYLVWVGSASDYTAFYYTQKRTEIEKLNFIYLGKKSDVDYYNHLNMCDGFVLLSREEPFGMVMIEAAYLGKPIVAFNSGGPSEFVLEGMGEVVPCFDIPKMADSMKKIMDGTTKIDTNILKKRALDFDVKNQIENWQQIIETI